MPVPEVFTLRNCDHEDIDDIVITLAKSFNIPNTALSNVITPGDLTTLLQQHGNNKQEMFNLVQDMFSERLSLDKSVLTRDEVLYQ